MTPVQQAYELLGGEETKKRRKKVIVRTNI